MSKRRSKGRMKRHHLKRFSAAMVNGGRASPRGGSRVDNTRSQFPVFQYRQHGAGMDGDEVARLLQAPPGSFEAMAPEKLQALMDASGLPEAIWDVSGGGLRLKPFHAQELLSGITMYFHGDDFFFMKRKHGIISRSLMYKGRKIAWAAYMAGKIRWVETTAPPREPPS